ncbi:MAG: VCBS repeat-containing protein, partial [Acidobacteriota bacterium]
LVAAAAALRCTSASPGGAATGAAPAPTPGAVGRVNPYVVEETDSYTIQRYPKSEYIRVDDRHIRHPILGVTVEFFREDEGYYYVSTAKHFPEEERLRAEAAAANPAAPASKPKTPATPVDQGPPLSDYSNLFPPRAAGRIRLEKLASSGLPVEGLWRSSFEVADVNEDGILDIVSPPSRIGGEPILHIFLGDGKGGFKRWPLTFTEAGKEKASDSGLDYGGVAVGDLDRDGHVDVVAASHRGGLTAFFGNGKGSFQLVRTGLPGLEFSAQTVALTDANRDGKLDIVGSRDILETDTGDEQNVDMRQVRVYIQLPNRAFQFHEKGINGGFYSNSLHAWDYNGDGLKDVLTASHYNGALTLLWKNEGDGHFSPVSFPEIEIYAFHFSTAPGTFGRERTPAFADAYFMSTHEPEVARAAGITLYAFRGGKWERHRVWRKKEGKTLLYGLGMGDLDGDRLDDIVFPDSEERRLKIFFQQADGTFVEAEEREEPALDSPGQAVRLADLDKDGRLDIVLSKTVSSTKADDRGGWDVYLNRR